MNITSQNHAKAKVDTLPELLSRSTYEPLILATDPKKNILLEDAMSEKIRLSKAIVVFNVGGTEFHVLRKNFATLPTTRLSRLIRATKIEEILKLCDGYVNLGPPHRPEYTFKRNPTFFNAILDLYRRGELHAPRNSCSLTFHEDLKFWGIDYYLMDACCILNHYSELEAAKTEAKLERQAKAELLQRLKEEDFGRSILGRVRKFLWNMTEHPDSGRPARVS